MPNAKKIFVLYFDLHINKKIKRKVFLNGENTNQALEFFLKKIKRDYKGLDISRIRIHQIGKKYNGKIITDKQWDRLLYLSYPNTKHKLRLFPTKMWFKPQASKNRNANGRFKKGNTPWNKNLKIKFFSKDEKGKFIDSEGQYNPDRECNTYYTVSTRDDMSTTLDALNLPVKTEFSYFYILSD